MTNHAPPFWAVYRADGTPYGAWTDRAVAEAIASRLTPPGRVRGLKLAASTRASATPPSLSASGLITTRPGCRSPAAPA